MGIFHTQKGQHADPSGGTLPERSALADLLTLLGGVVFCLVLAALWLLRGAFQAWAIGFLVFIALFVPMLVAVECLALYIVNRGARASLIEMPAPRLATVGELVRVWWSESITSMRVFGVWQPRLWRTEPCVWSPEMVGRTGVVFVHGYFCNRGLWLPHLLVMRKLGVPTIAVNLEPVFGSIDRYAPIIEDAVARMTAITGRAPVLVGHSMGGLAIRAWLRTTNMERIKRVITIGTPHHGTWTAQFSHAPNGKQMCLGSAWLAQLAADEAPIAEALHSRFDCIYSAADNIVFPAVSACLMHASNAHVAATGHVELAYSPLVMRGIERALSDTK